MTTYLRDSEGKFIPSTQRPDGTWRKARRVKDGYVPQEEVPLYESKGKQFAKKPTLPVGLSPLIAQAAKEKREKQERQQQKQQQMANKTAGLIPIEKVLVAGERKRTKNPSDPCSTSGGAIAKNKDIKQLSDGIGNINLATAHNTTTTTTNNSEEDMAKQLRKLRKKIRAIEAIEERLKSGDLKNPEQDQLDKVARKACILDEIKELEERQK